MFRSDITVDWSSSPRIITVLAPSTAVVMQDLYDTLRILESDISNIDNPYIVSGSGKESLGSGVYVGLTVTLNNAQLAFESRPGPSFVQCTATGGNLVAVDENNAEMSSIYPTAYTQVILTSSSSATLQELSAIQYASFNEMVHYSITGSSGTTYPIGTHMFPVNNLTDAKLIALERGFNTVHLESDLTITSGEIVDELTFKSDNWLTVVVDPSVSLVNTNFEKVSLYGTMGGFWNVLIDCWVYDVSNFCGWMRGGSFVRVELAPYTYESAGQSFFDSTLPMYPSVPAVLVCNTNVSVSFTNTVDVYEIQSLTSGSLVNIGFDTGELILHSSCVGGTVLVSGIATITNNSSPGCVLIDNTVTEEGIANHTWIYDITTSVDPSSASYSLWNAPKKVLNKVLPFLFAK